MNSSLTLTWSGQPLRGKAQLPASKSESNRALILQALAGGGTLANLSDANDTQLMQRLLADPAAPRFDAEDAGTVMRFLTGYLAATGRHTQLTGTARMLERPIGVLVEALRELGAAIEYEGREGYPPLRLRGWHPTDAAAAPAEDLTELTVRGDISSQYISALLMVGPTLPHGLRLRLTGKVGSRPYIRMTLALMQHFGGDCRDLGTVVEARPGTYQPTDYTVESDWSAASYWYAMVALAPPGSWLTLPGLRRYSWQGDQAIVGIMENLGVATEFLADESVRLTQTGRTAAFTQDFTDCPDLAQTVAVVAAALGVSVLMTGLESLRIKETDRIFALQTELANFGAFLTEETEGHFRVSTGQFQVAGQTVSTYHDHRMAMAFAPLALLGPLTIEAPQVVRKSYPQFWKELEQVGFEVVL